MSEREIESRGLASDHHCPRHHLPRARDLEEFRVSWRDEGFRVSWRELGRKSEKRRGTSRDFQAVIASDREREREGGKKR